MRKHAVVAGLVLSMAVGGPLWAYEGGDPSAGLSGGDQQGGIGGAAEEYQLSFQQVSVDTPIVFLPTREEVSAQREALRSAPDRGGDGVFQDGWIGLTAQLAPPETALEQVSLQFCLEVESSCVDLLVWDSERGVYGESLVIPDLGVEVGKSVYLDLLIPPALAEELKGGALDQPEPFSVWVAPADEPDAWLPLAAVDLVDLPEEPRIPRSASRQYYSRPFVKNFDNSNFGAGIDANGFSKLEDNRAEFAARATADITVFGNDFEFVMARGDAALDLSEGGEASVRVEFLGYLTLYQAGQSLDAKWNSRRSFVKEKGYSKTILVGGFVPIKVAAGASGELGVQWEFFSENSWRTLGGRIGPFADAGAYAKATLNLGIAEGGIKGRLSLLRDDFWLTTRINISSADVSGEITNDLSGPGGKIGPYASWSEPAIAYERVCVSIPWVGRYCKNVPYPTVERKEAFYALVDWRSYVRSDTLLRF